MGAARRCPSSPQPRPLLVLPLPSTATALPAPTARLPLSPAHLGPHSPLALSRLGLSKMRSAGLLLLLLALATSAGECGEGVQGRRSAPRVSSARQPSPALPPPCLLCSACPGPGRRARRGAVRGAAAADRRLACGGRRPWRHQPHAPRHPRQRGGRGPRVPRLQNHRVRLAAATLLARRRGRGTGAAGQECGRRRPLVSFALNVPLSLPAALLLCSDMPLKAPPAEVAAAFSALHLPSDPQARNQTLSAFVQHEGGWGLRGCCRQRLPAADGCARQCPAALLQRPTRPSAAPSHSLHPLPCSPPAVADAPRLRPDFIQPDVGARPRVDRR
jgi:hypothetical protein